MLPLVNRTAQALSFWLAPGDSRSASRPPDAEHEARFPQGRRLAQTLSLQFRPDLDAVEALSAERDALWRRLESVSFLTDDEKRAAIGYGVRPTEGKGETALRTRYFGTGYLSEKPD